MNTSNFEWPVDKKPLYSLLSIRLRGLIDGIPHQISNLANASALLGDALLNINWVGFYLMREGRLVLGYLAKLFGSVFRNEHTSLFAKDN